MGYEWDDRKQEANLKTHGVDFVRAAKMFATRWSELMIGKIMARNV